MPPKSLSEKYGSGIELIRGNTFRIYGRTFGIPRVNYVQSAFQELFSIEFWPWFRFLSEDLERMIEESDSQCLLVEGILPSKERAYAILNGIIQLGMRCLVEEGQKSLLFFMGNTIERLHSGDPVVTYSGISETVAISEMIRCDDHRGDFADLYYEGQRPLLVSYGLLLSMQQMEKMDEKSPLLKYRRI